MTDSEWLDSGEATAIVNYAAAMRPRREAGCGSGNPVSELWGH